MSRLMLLHTCRIRVGGGCRLSAVHAHQIVLHMQQMIGVVSTAIQGQNITVAYEADEVSTIKVENYLCAAVHPFGRQRSAAIRAAFAQGSNASLAIPLKQARSVHNSGE